MSMTGAGTTLGISAAAPATHDATGFAALTFIEVGGIDKLGPLGPVPNKVEFQPLKGPKQKKKGSTDYGTLSPSMAYEKADAGQTLMAAAAASIDDYSFCVTYPNGDKRYFGGAVFGFPETVDTADAIVMINPTIEINTTIVKVNAA